MKYLYIVILFFAALPAYSKIDLVTLPPRDSVQLTIYNSADITLVRENRPLILKKGENHLQFGWANTLIDPTSLELLPRSSNDEIKILELAYPPRTDDVGVWTMISEISGSVPIEISFFTSGIKWRAFYLGTLSKDEKSMSIEGYIRVTNSSGEDYDNAQVRLVIGKINLLDDIMTLAKRHPPYDKPQESRLVPTRKTKALTAASMMRLESADAIAEAKEIMKEGLSEYQLYTIEGRETIPDKWSKRLPSFKKDDIPVVSLYRYDESRYQDRVVQFLSLKNDKDHNLGTEILPEGDVKIFREIDNENHISYIGDDRMKYIPLNEKIELNLGSSTRVEVKPKLMEYKTENYTFNNPGGNISGWDEVIDMKYDVDNTRDIPVLVEIFYKFPHAHWKLGEPDAGWGYEKIDFQTARFFKELNPHLKESFTYTVRIYEGDRQEKH